MGQTAESATAQRVAKLGLQRGEYDKRVANGEKYCAKCRAWHPVEQFAADGSRYDRLSNICKAQLALRRKLLPRGAPRVAPKPRTSAWDY